MPRFDLSQYATVEERLRAFWSDDLSKDARIVTINHSKSADLWIIETRIYLTAGDQATDLPKVTGWASEANTDQFSLERCETSSIGRCLANWLWTGSKKLDGTPRPSQQEMEKVERVSAVDVMHEFAQRDWKKDADTLNDVDALRTLWGNAKAKRAPQNVLDYIKERANALSDTSSVNRGAEGGISGLFDTPEDSPRTGSVDPEPKAKGRK